MNKKEFLSEKVTPILEPLVIDLLMKKPDDPVDFMISYLTQLRTEEDGEGMYETDKF